MRSLQELYDDEDAPAFIRSAASELMGHWDEGVVAWFPALAIAMLDEHEKAVARMEASS